MAAMPHSSPKGKRAPTPDQRRAQKEIALLSDAWNKLQDDERRAWDETARQNRRAGPAARRRFRTGRRLFFRANSHRLALNQSLLAHPNEASDLCDLPLVQLVITNHAGRPVIRLRASGGPTDGVMVSSWHPLNAGVIVWRKFVRLGPLPPPRRGLCDITKMFVEKYGVPPVGTKIFVRIQQMRDTLGKLFQITSAVVRPEEAW
jgi:hypothetical protein